MTILLFGKNGQLGWELQKSLALLGDIVSLSRQDVDLTDIESIKHIIKKTKPLIIVNAAAYTAVDKAEEDVESAYKINATAVRIMATEAKLLDAWFVHYSTDYVFDGMKTDPYSELDSPSPLNIYGRTKLQGETFTKAICDKYFILRTSWVYSSRGKNFAKTVLKRGTDCCELNVIADQFGVPTSAELIADVTRLALYEALNNTHKNYSGLYHLTARGKTTWYDYAYYLLNAASENGIKIKAKIKAIPASQYLTAAKRPSNSSLDVRKIEDTFNIHLPNWKYHVDKLIEEIANNYKEMGALINDDNTTD